MFRIFSVLAITAALVFPVSALSAGPNQPNRFELAANVTDIHNCLHVGEVTTYTVRVANISNHDVVATVSPSYIGNDQYSFQYVGSKPTLGSVTTNLTDPNGNSYSYTTWQWQQRIKSGKTATFSVTVKVPAWNFPVAPSTDPVTGEVYSPPAPQPYPQTLMFDIGVLGSTGGLIVGGRSAYCQDN